MISLQKAYYLCNIALIVLVLAASGCAGRRAGGGGAPSTPSRPAPGTHPGAVLPLVPGIHEPAVRIGLKTDAKSTTIESDNELYVSDGSRTVAGGQRVVASPSFLAAVSTSYSVQVQSFSSRDNADRAREDLARQTSRRVFVYHNADRNLEQLRVGPFSTQEEAQKVALEMKALGHPEAFYVSDDAGSQNQRAELVVKDDSGSVLLRTRGAVQIWAQDLKVRIDQDRYRGFVRLNVNSLGRLTVVNVLNYEEYLRGVVPNEIGGGSTDTYEALKAQAIAARTYAYKNRGQFEKDGYDICSTARCQVYTGMKNEGSLTDQAVQETAGQVMTYAGQPINALYTSTCGGRTENSEYMFENMTEPYLKSVECYPEETNTRQYSAKLEGTMQPWWLSWLTAKTGKSYGGDLTQPLQSEEAEQAVADLLDALGKASCYNGSLRATDWVTTGDFLVQSLCWQAKRDSLLTEKDYQYFLSHLNFALEPKPETHSFLFLFHDDILVPDASTLNRFNPYSTLKRQDFYHALFEILDHYHQVNPSKGQAREVRPGEIQVVDDVGVHLFPLASPVYLYQILSDKKISREDLACSPGDRVEYYAEEGKISILACELSQAGASVDRSSKYTFWTDAVTPSDLGVRISKYADVGDVQDLQPLTYGLSGRIYQLKITGSKGSAVLAGIRVRWALGLKDNLFTIDRTVGRDGRVREFQFTGRGWGHGVGMCQVGALGYARMGWDSNKILQHYYSGIQISKVW